MLDLAKRVLTRMVPHRRVVPVPNTGRTAEGGRDMRNALRIARLIAHKLIADMMREDEWNVTTYRARRIFA